MTQAQLKAAGEINFASDDNMMTVSYGQISTWDYPYKIMFNGEVSSYRSFFSLTTKMHKLIENYGLVKVEA